MTGRSGTLETARQILTVRGARGSDDKPLTLYCLRSSRSSRHRLYESVAMLPSLPSSVFPGVEANPSQIDGPLPSFVSEPSIWKEAVKEGSGEPHVNVDACVNAPVAVPHRNPSGSVFASVIARRDEKCCRALGSHLRSAAARLFKGKQRNRRARAEAGVLGCVVRPIRGFPARRSERCRRHIESNVNRRKQGCGYGCPSEVNKATSRQVLNTIVASDFVCLNCQSASGRMIRPTRQTVSFIGPQPRGGVVAAKLDFVTKAGRFGGSKSGAQTSRPGNSNQ